MTGVLEKLAAGEGSGATMYGHGKREKASYSL
jgi:hypothetical protein